MPNGSFTADARKSGYIDADNISLELEDNTVSHDFILRELTSSISGYVYDAVSDESLYDVNVYVYEMDENGNYNNSIASDWVSAGDNGSYNVVLPDGCFQVRFNKYSNNEMSYMELTHDFCVESEDYVYDAHMQQIETPSHFSGYIIFISHNYTRVPS